MKLRNTFLSCGAALLILVGAAAQQKPAAQYPELAKKVMAGDLSVDFWTLRTSCFDWPDCAGYDVDGAKQGMFRALQANDYAGALTDADEILSHKVTDLDAQVIAWVADRKLGNAKEAAAHEAITKKLMDSIMQGRDGKSVQTAWVVVEVPEEYSVLRLLGLRPKSQSLLNAGGHSYDEMTVSDGTNDIKLYFNIDFDMKRLNDALGGAQKK